MIKLIVPVETVLSVKQCECGGFFDTQVGQRYFGEKNMAAEFKCNKCGKIVMLTEDDFPEVKYRYKTEK